MQGIAAFAWHQHTWGGDHFRRPRNQVSLAAQLFAWRDEAWLQARRRDPLIGGSSRSGIRAHSVYVNRLGRILVPGSGVLGRRMNSELAHQDRISMMRLAWRTRFPMFPRQH